MWNLSVPNVLFLIPVINVVYPFLIGMINRLGQQIESVIYPLGKSISNLANLSFIGDIWIAILIVNFGLMSISFVHANIGERLNKDYNVLGISCIISFFLSLVVTYYLF